MTNTVNRLEELLDIRDEQLQQRDETIRRLERQVEFGVDWMLHQYTQKEDESLPLPRLHLALTKDTPHYQEFKLCMVLANIGSQVSYVPLAYSKRSGNAGELARVPANGELTDRDLAAMPNIVIDGAFQMESTGLPFYVQLDNKRIYKVTSGRPLQMHAI